MNCIVIDMQSGLTARGYERILLSDMRGCSPVVSDNPKDTVKICKMFLPGTLMLEVSEHKPWTLTERLGILEEVKNFLPDCKFVFAVDENAYPEVSEEVAYCKKNGSIDAFIFTSSSDRFLVSMLKNL